MTTSDVSRASQSATPAATGAPTLRFTITIDGIDHTVIDDDQEASALLRLAGLDPRTHDLFVIDDSGVEEHVKDEQIVDLTDGARFSARRRVHFTIDGCDHTTWDNDQSATALLELAGVDPTGYDLARITVTGSPTAFTTDQIVTLEEGDEFVTAKRVGGVA